VFRYEVLEAEREGKALPPAPFATGGATRFYEWLTETRADNDRQLPRYLDLIWMSRGDLQAAFPEVTGGHLDRYLHWINTQGVVERPTLQLFAGQAQEALKAVAPSVRRDAGVDVVGYFNAELGVGEAGRLAVTALCSGDVATNTLGTRRTTSRQQHNFATSNQAEFTTALIAVNADQLANIRHDLRESFAGHTYLIGQWFWELEQFPPHMHSAYALIDEVWAATRHIQIALEASAPQGLPVTLMHLPLVTPTVAPGIDKAFFGLPDRFAFLFTFDFFSVLQRKNPMAVVDAFVRAFGNNQGPILVLKTINGHQRLRDLEQLRWACRGRDDIFLIDDYLDAPVTAALTNACDCYVSLHRAEGLGLTMAEAMTLGKPVIATGYSGNVDFMTPETSYLVPYEIVPVGNKAAPYQAEATWAQPDVDAAADIMREVFHNQNEAAQRGVAAQRDLLARFSPQVTGQNMKNRLIQIGRLSDA
jgi:glycosyltransferase involved in cell wall biosynthesis